MKTKAAIRYFGSRPALAKALGIQAPPIYKWGPDVPALRQLQIEMLTGGKLKADPELHLKAVPKPKVRRRKKPKARPQIGPQANAAPPDVPQYPPNAPEPVLAVPPRSEKSADSVVRSTRQTAQAWARTDAGIMARAVELGVAPLPGETYAALRHRLLAIGG